MAEERQCQQGLRAQIFAAAVEPHIPPLEELLPPVLPAPILLPVDPVVEVAREPLVELPLDPTTGVLGTTGATLGGVAEREVLAPRAGTPIRPVPVGGRLAFTVGFAWPLP